MSDVDRICLALSDPVRLSTLRLLRQGPMRPSALAQGLSISRPTMSRHLKILRRAELVTDAIHQDDDARVRLYRLRREPFSELKRFAAYMEEFWQPVD